jgi:hypothetical protein
VPKVRTYTDETKLGHINDDIDALYTLAEGDVDLADLADVVITSPADNEVLAYDSGSGDWINQTPAEAGLLDTTTAASTYLKLDGSNDPYTGDVLVIQNAAKAQLTLDDTAGQLYAITANADNLSFFEGGTRRFRYQKATGVLELPAPSSTPSGLESGRAAVYLDETNDHLRVLVKDSGASTYNAYVGREHGDIVHLGPGSAALSGTASLAIKGANTDVPCVEFHNGATDTAAWAFTPPRSWFGTTGKIRIKIYWMNYGANVTGNHYVPQRLMRCAEGEHTAATQTCEALVSGNQTITGLNDSSKVGVTTIDDSGDTTFDNLEAYFYRVQRLGANGADTSSQLWEVILVTIELI